MIRLHGTTKLLAKLPLAANGTLKQVDKDHKVQAKTLEALNPLSGWQGNVVSIQSRNCVLLRHDQTGFLLFMACVTKEQFACFDTCFNHHLTATLRLANASERQLEALEQLLQPLIVDEHSQPTSTQCLNQTKASIERILWNDNASLMKIDANVISHQLNGDITMSGSDRPLDAMLAMLESSAQSFARRSHATPQSAPTAKTDNVVSFADFHAPKDSNL